MKVTAEKPARFQGLLWSAFSGTAMVSAFGLPSHFFAFFMGYRIAQPVAFPEIFFRIYFFVLIACGLYHSLYRVKTIVFDLGWIRAEKMMMVFTLGLFLITTAVAAILLFS